MERYIWTKIQIHVHVDTIVSFVIQSGQVSKGGATAVLLLVNSHTVFVFVCLNVQKCNCTYYEYGRTLCKGGCSSWLEYVTGL